MKELDGAQIIVGILFSSQSGLKWNSRWMKSNEKKKKKKSIYNVENVVQVILMKLA